MRFRQISGETWRGRRGQRGAEGAEGMATQRPRVVLKVGTSSLVSEGAGGGGQIARLSGVCEAAARLRGEGFEVVIVSSGAVGIGAETLGLQEPPKDLARKQALAAVGQGRLMGIYDNVFSAIRVKCAQVLLTLENLADESQYNNVKNTFEELFRYGIVPIVNENDTVAVKELRFGDNDTLSAQVANLVGANWLFLLTDVDALYTSNPSTNTGALPIRVVEDLNALKADVGSAGSSFGTGGMYTKLVAARLAAAGGCHTVICISSRPDEIPKILNGEPLGTVILPLPQPAQARGRKRWILGVPAKGEVWLDRGAQKALLKKKSVFGAGIVRVAGEPFDACEGVMLCNEKGLPLAKGLSNYSAAEVNKVQGKSSQEMQEILQYAGPAEVFYRGNVCLLESELPKTPEEPAGIPTVPSWPNMVSE